MKNVKLLIIVIFTVFSVMIGACKAVPESGSMQAVSVENTIPGPDSIQIVPAKSILSVEGKDNGCMSCHEGIEVINDRMQPYLLLFAKQKYGKGRSFPIHPVCGYFMREKVAQSVMMVKGVLLP